MPDASITEIEKPETKAGYIRDSHEEIKNFFDELKTRGLTTPFTGGEYYYLSQYGTLQAGKIGELEFSIARHPKKYFLSVKTVVSVARSLETGRSEEVENFDIYPKSVTYEKIKLNAYGRAVLEHSEVSDSLFSKKGKLEEAKHSHDRLLLVIDKIREVMEQHPDLKSYI